MKIIDAIWELRNMGIRTIEMELFPEDEKLITEKDLKGIDAPYNVIKIPSGMPRAMQVVQNAGFSFIEDVIELIHDLHEPVRPRLLQRLHDAVTVEPIGPVGLLALEQEIRKGMFSTDRVSLDPMFTPEQAASRYIGWLHDELDRGTELLNCVYKGNPISFFGIRDCGDGNYNSFLSGCYEQYRSGGLGCVLKTPDEVRRRHGKSVNATVSTNNLAQLRALIINGYVPVKVSHIFIRHTSNA